MAKAKPKVTFLWLTRNKTKWCGNDYTVTVWTKEPTKHGGTFDTPRDAKGRQIADAWYCSFHWKTWRKENPELRLYRGQIRKIKRTSLKHGFSWRICK